MHPHAGARVHRWRGLRKELHKMADWLRRWFTRGPARLLHDERSATTLEVLEARLVLNTDMVLNTNDDGLWSLRQATGSASSNDRSSSAVRSPARPSP